MGLPPESFQETSETGHSRVDTVGCRTVDERERRSECASRVHPLPWRPWRLVEAPRRLGEIHREHPVCRILDLAGQLIQRHALQSERASCGPNDSDGAQASPTLADCVRVRNRCHRVGGNREVGVAQNGEAATPDKPSGLADVASRELGVRVPAQDADLGPALVGVREVIHHMVARMFDN